MSDLLEAAAAALATPVELVRRSAAARAEATGATIDEILAAWAGGVAPPPPTQTAPEAPAAVTEPTRTAETSQAPVLVAAVAVAPAPEPEPAEPLEPASLGKRLGTAVRLGAWAGAALGVIGLLLAGAMWAPGTLVGPEGGPVVAVDSSGILIGSALISFVFGSIVAGLSRAGTAWVDPAMQLAGSNTATMWLGGVTGLVLGVAGGAALAGQGVTVEGSDGLVQIPILGTMLLLVAGGALLGAATAALPQLLGTPVAVAPEDQEEVAAVRRRLGNAITIPTAGILLLVVLAIPFAYALIESNHLSSGAAAIIAIIMAGGILGFATLSGARPQMRITFGELMVAVAGIATVLLIIIAVLFFRSIDDHATEGEHASAVELTV